MYHGLPRGFYLRSFSREDIMKRERFRPDTCVMRGSGLWPAILLHLPLWSKHFAGDRRGAWPPGPEVAVQCTAQLLSIPSPSFWVHILQTLPPGLIGMLWPLSLHHPGWNFWQVQLTRHY